MEFKEYYKLSTLEKKEIFNNVDKQIKENKFDKEICKNIAKKAEKEKKYNNVFYIWYRYYLDNLDKNNIRFDTVDNKEIIDSIKANYE